MSRKLFCEISPLCYNLSVAKERTKRNIKNYFDDNKIANSFSKEELPNIVKFK